ncbi:MAG TPA: response regulator [Gammaproteobacteria bacterium]
MNVETSERTISIAPINLAPAEVGLIKDALSSNATVEGSSGYTLLSRQSAKDAQILVVNLYTPDINRTRQLLRRIYGNKSAVFIVPDSGTIQRNEYKYQLRQKDLTRNLVDILDQISRDELADYLKADGHPEKTTHSIDFANNNRNTKKHIGRVLIVDDSPSVRTQMNLYLGKRMFECHMAENSEQAIRAIKQTRFDIIFLDVMMPGVDGYQACKAIKSFESAKQIPVILLTSKNSPIDKIHGIMSGCDKYLTKPVRSSELDSLLRSYFPSLTTVPATGI